MDKKFKLDFKAAVATFNINQALVQGNTALV